MVRRAGRRADKQLRAVHSPPLPKHRTRADGWTDERRRAFLRALSETACVRDACARVGMASTSVYRLKRLHPAFARAWELAIRRAMPTIEQAAYERAVVGWEEPIVHGGKVVGTRRRYSDALLRLLLQRGSPEPGRGARPGSRAAIELAHEAARLAGGRFVTRRATAEETDRALTHKLDALERRMRVEAAERAHGAADATARAADAEPAR